jgi:hypothetical protein
MNTLSQKNGKVGNLVRAALLVVAANVMISGVQAEDGSAYLAKSKDVAGKFQVRECNTFAKDLYKRFARAGGEAYLVVYDWTNLKRDFRSQGSGRHAMVVYRDAKGRYYGVDNATWKPVWLKGSTPSEWAAFFAGMDQQTSVVSSQTVASNKGQYPNLAQVKAMEKGTMIASR